MKKFLTGTALTLALCGVAAADDHLGMALITYDQATERNLAASELTGMRVYASEADVDATVRIADGGERDWNDIGEINELYITPEGEVAAVIVGVGGFLGIGERDVAVDMSEIRLVREEGNSDDFFLVIEASRAELENAPVFERADDMEMSSTSQSTMETGTQSGMAADRMMFVAPTLEREGFQGAEPNELTAETLIGANVYGVNDEDIGEVGDLIMNGDGKVQDVVLDIGGFLGLGEKHVRLSMSEVQVLRSQDGGEVRVYVDANQESLEQMPEYTGNE